ncbi:hypothetical protein Glove_50g21 [Diversispora epigaea]|uniref:Uncharacterized protein n=1 Tax=Diversispora epigaea TaxID=1348612 RepID=A0A397JMU3_9GLOM|nr:hypothetical protein Glove_50g21 [Diversispora epigaea]
MTNWQLKKIKEVQKEPVIDFLKDAFKGRQHKTKIIMIEGSCETEKSTFVEKCKKYLTRYKKTVEILDELFITKDSSKRIINYGSSLKKYKEKKITKEQIEEIAIELKEWIRDKWMKQIFEFYTRDRKPSILLMDRNLFSTLIFMKLMEEERFFSKEKQKESWLIRESLVIWWKTPVEKTIKRIEKQGRTGEEDLKYYKNLDEVYRKLIYSEELDIEQIHFGYNNMPPTKRRKTDEETITGRYNLKRVKATKEWTRETFEIQNIRKKGEALELKALQILRAQNIITNMLKAHLLEETKEKMKLKQIIGDGGIDTS